MTNVQLKNLNFYNDYLGKYSNNIFTYTSNNNNNNYQLEEIKQLKLIIQEQNNEILALKRNNDEFIQYKMEVKYNKQLDDYNKLISVLNTIILNKN
jgi:hypothetical protein